MAPWALVSVWMKQVSDVQLVRLERTALDNGDVTLKSLVDLYRYRREDYANFEEFLLEAIETMSLAHKLTQNAFRERIATSPVVVHMPVEQWRDMNN